MIEDMQRLRSEADRLAAATIAQGGRILGLNDQAVVETVVRMYFRTLPAAGTRHVVDVGAAYGYIAETFLKQGWTADLLEPDPDWQATLKRLTAYGSRMRLFPFAAADRDEDSVTFHLNKTPGLAGLAPSPLGGTTRTVAVRAVRLDSFVAEQNIGAIDFLKIDTEGHDLQVLRGARGLLDRRAVRIIQFEYGQANIESRDLLKDFFAFFRDYGFNLHKINAEGYSLHLRYNARLDNFQYQNWLAVGEK